MSPSESDLRAALSDGEGARPNVDLVIMRAEARAAQRRTKLLSAAVIVGVVAAAGVGGVFLSQHSGHDEKAASSNGAGAGAALSAPTAAAAGGGSNGIATSTTACPTDVKRAGEYAADGKPIARTSMFTAQVSTVVVCAYYVTHSAQAPLDRSAARTNADQVVLHGAQASQLVQSLKRAATKRPSGACPMIRKASQPVVIIALTSDGAVAGTASTDLGVPVCNVIVVDGTTARYNWSPPAILAPALAKLAPIRSTPQPRASPTH